MKSTGKTLSYLAIILAVVSIPTLAGASQTIFYPSQDNPSFSVTAPDNWELGQAEEEGGYFDLTGPTGAVLYFRNIDGTLENLEGAITDAVDYLGENYSDVQLGDAQDHKINGLEGFYAVGSGKDADGESVVFGIGWYALKDGSIGEIWFVAAAGDKAGAKAADQLLNTFKAR